MFTITYTCSFLGPLIGGALWDLSGLPLMAFAPSWIAGFAMIALASSLRLPSPLVQVRGHGTTVG
jgi:CP family cyanate transporter-like MFS transporter